MPAELTKTLPPTLPVRKLGIQYPVLIGQGEILWNNQIDVDDPANAGEPRKITVPRYDVVVQFCWQEILPDKRTAGAPAAPANGN